MNPADWPDEAALLPYSALQALPAQRLLVLAPHPDDEVLGCGGLIAAMLQRGAMVQVAIVSDGAQGGDAPRRERESIAAAQVLAAGHAAPVLEFWRLPDRGLATDPRLVPRLQHVLARAAADVVLLPSPFEVHPDHRALCLAGLHALRTFAGAEQVLFYEIGQALMPDLLIDITPQVERKRAALRCFGSQLAGQAYDEQVLGLNRFRAYSLGPTVTHAEGYRRLDLQQLRSGGLASALDGINHDLRRRFGLA